MRRVFIFIALYFFISEAVLAQTTNKRQQELEVHRLRLKKEIKQINALLFTNTKTRKNALTEAED